MLANLLKYDSLQRNLAQTREGGADCIEVPGWAIEVKGCERFLSAWFDQAKRQAGADRLPAVMWKQNRKPWRVFVELTPEQFADLVKKADNKQNE